jgi:hypothetical protein
MSRRRLGRGELFPGFDYRAAFYSGFPGTSRGINGRDRAEFGRRISQVVDDTEKQVLRRVYFSPKSSG